MIKNQRNLIFGLCTEKEKKDKVHYCVNYVPFYEACSIVEITKHFIITVDSGIADAAKMASSICS